MRNAELEEAQAGIKIAGRVLASAAHILKLERYREDKHGPCARMTRKFVKRSIFKKKKKRLQGEISITSDIQMTPPLWQKVKRN